VTLKLAGRPGDKVFSPTRSVDDSIANGTVFAAQEAACVWLKACPR
jgi:hypothetical protein